MTQCKARLTLFPGNREINAKKSRLGGGLASLEAHNLLTETHSLFLGLLLSLCLSGCFARNLCSCFGFQVQGLQGYIAHKKDLGFDFQGLQGFLALKKGFGFEVAGLGLTVWGLACGVYGLGVGCGV